MYTLDPLPYDFSALEPYIDATTMRIHYGKHHQAYVDNLNKALEEANIYTDMNVFELMASLDDLPESVRTVVQNNGGGHANHSFFWESMTDKGPQDPQGELAKALQLNFQEHNEQQMIFNFKAQFTKAAMSRFGSGWAWLCARPDKSLFICSTANQDNPWMQGILQEKSTPILGLDVWEHAYYLHYQNKRADYVNAFWNVIDWRKVEARYAAI